MSDYFEQQMARQRQRPATETHPRPQGGGSSRVRQTEGFESFVFGALDTVTFGFLDEAGAWIDSKIMGRGDYDTLVEQNRALLGQMQEEHGGAYLAGQIGGAFVPFVGVAGRARQAIAGSRLMQGARGFAITGAAQGALYGMGSDTGNFFDRMDGAAMGGVLGAGAGYVLGAVLMPAARNGARQIAAAFRRGRSPRLTTDFQPTASRITREGSDELAELRTDLNPATRTRPKANAANPEGRPLRFNAITGEADDVLEDGALLTMRELLGDPGAARAALQRRIGKLSQVEAQRIAQRLEDAELDGNVIDDPHYRSLLGINLADTDIDSATAMNAVQLLEEASEEIAKRAGVETRSMNSMRSQATDQLRQGLIMSDLEKALAESRKGIANTRIAQHAMMLAGVQFVRAKDKFLPLIQNGVAGAREELTEALTKAAHIMALSKGIVGNAGRNLGQLRDSTKLLVDDIGDDLMEVPTLDALRKRVDASLKELGDDDLRDLIGRLRTADDIAKIEDVLLDASKAKDFSGWRRSMNSLSLFLRSNALTPATGLFNTISFVGHDFFRNGIAKRWAARNFERAGKTDDAMALRFELEVGRRVYMEAHRKGFKAFVKRIKWETWGEVEKIAAVGWGRGRVAAKARAKRGTMLQNGYAPNGLREYTPPPRASVTDLEGFNTRLATRRSEGGAFANLVYHAHRAVAVAGNTVDALGGASMKLFTGALDDMGREFIKVKETYALSARQAIREAMEEAKGGNLTQEQMLQLAQKRAVELAEMPPSDILAKAEARLLKGDELDDELKFLMRRDKEVDLEADRTLFMDGPQTGGGKVSAQFAAKVDKFVGLGQVEGILLPYIRTPIRLFERGLVSYTPWGKASKEVQAALKKGGVEAEIVKAQMEAGFMGIKIGMLAGMTGAITLTNGGWDNSGNLDAGPPNRINFPGGGYVEMGRLDPFALTLALGGFIGQAVNAGFRKGTEYDAETGVHGALEIAWLAIRDSVLEKSYLTGLQDLMEVAFARETGGTTKGLEKMLQGAFTRVIPLSGTSRQISDTIRGSAPETIGWVDQLLRAVPGGSLFMSDRINPLGDEVDGRLMGVAVGAASKDPVVSELRDMGIDITSLKKADPSGFALTSHELSELRRIRGKEAYNRQGLTMRDALAELFADPEFQNLPEADQKRDAVVELMAGFNEPARAIMEERNPNYLSNREANKAFKDYLDAGLSNDQSEAQAREDVQLMGLPEPDRL